MHNIKFIREKFDEFKKLIESRNIKIDFDQIIDLDKKNRNLIQKKENLEKEKKEISKSKDKSQFARSKDISTEIDKFNTICTEIIKDINKTNDTEYKFEFSING